VAAPVASSRLSVNVFTAPGKAMVGERPKLFGEALGFDPITSTLIFGENDAVLVDAMTTVAEAEALAAWIALHNRNLETIYYARPTPCGCLLLLPWSGYLQDFDRVQKIATSDQDLFDQMTKLYPIGWPISRG
jgi:hypothetical protein